MLERMRREAWWMGLAHSAVLVFFMVFLLFAGVSLAYFTVRLAQTSNASVESYLLLLLGWTVLFGVVLSLLWHLSRRLKVSDLLVQVKELEMRLLELEERAMVVRVDQ
jgi:hypothetical protein